LALLPSVLLLVLGLAVWLVRNRQERVVWAVSVAGQWLVWLVLLGLHRFVPSSLSLSVWRPAEVFRTPLVLSLDATGWTMAFSIATLLLAIGLTSAARSGSATAATRAFLAVYGALGMAAVVAGNLLTLAVLWAMMEVVAFSTSLVLIRKRDIIPREIQRLAVQGTSITLLLGTAVLLGADGIRASTSGIPALGYIFGFAAAFIRWGLFPAHYPLPSLPGIRRGLGTCLRLLPAAMGMVLITRLLQNNPSGEILLGLAWTGGVLALGSGIAWALHTDPVQRRPMLVLGLAGLTICAAGLSPTGMSWRVALGGSASLILIGGMVSLAEPHESWQKWWVLLAAFMLLGGPLTPGQTIIQAMAGARQFSPVVAGGLGLLAGVVLTLGILRGVEIETNPWPSGEQLVRVSYVAGIVLIPIAGIGISFGVSSLPSMRSLGVFVAISGASAVAYYAYVRAGSAVRLFVAKTANWIRWPDLPADVLTILVAPLNALVWVGGLIQGEAGLLWILFLLLVLAAIVGSGS